MEAGEIAFFVTLICFLILFYTSHAVWLFDLAEVVMLFVELVEFYP